MLNCAKTTTCSRRRDECVDARAAVRREQPALAALCLLAAGRHHRNRHRRSRRCTSPSGSPTIRRRPTTIRRPTAATAANGRGILLMRAEAYRPQRRAAASSRSRSRGPIRPSSNAATPASAVRTNRTGARAKRPCRLPGKALTRSDVDRVTDRRLRQSLRQIIMTIIHIAFVRVGARPGGLLGSRRRRRSRNSIRCCF